MPEDNVHKGIVSKIECDTLTIKVLEDADANCDGCKIAVICGQNKDQGTVRIGVDNASDFAVGDVVRFYTSRSSQQKGIVLAFIIPIVLVVGLTLGLLHAGLGDGASLLTALGVTMLYYGVLYLLRHHVAGQLKWKVIKTNQ